MCIQAQQLVLRDATQLLSLQRGLSVRESALDKPLGTGSPAKTSAAKGGAGSVTVPVNAAQLVADQSAVDAATASLAVAQEQLGQAAIISPFAGVVSSVGLTVGQQATAGSTTSAIDVIDPTGHGVTLSVDVTKIASVKVGQEADVLPDGSATALAATVTYVAAAPNPSSTAYKVQLAFASKPTRLRDGIQAAVKITTSQAADVLAVPTSAIRHRGTLGYVLVLEGSTTRQQSTREQIVTAGAVGAVYTQITQGLTAGQRVVLADPSQAIPTNTITGRVARLTGGVANPTGVLSGTAGTGGPPSGR
jgi:RND family efflux transporter MFP subunit